MYQSVILSINQNPAKETLCSDNRLEWSIIVISIFIVFAVLKIFLNKNYKLATIAMQILAGVIGILLILLFSCVKYSIIIIAIETMSFIAIIMIKKD